jgi:hypothetical protein
MMQWFQYERHHSNVIGSVVGFQYFVLHVETDFQYLMLIHKNHVHCTVGHFSMS